MCERVYPTGGRGGLTVTVVGSTVSKEQWRVGAMQKNPILVIADKESQELYRTIFSIAEKIESYFCNDLIDFSKCREVDMVLLDCGFSPESGLALLETIKSSMPHVPVVFVTDVSSESIAINAFRAGVIDYFKKPVNLLLLRDITEKLLMVKRSTRERRTRIEKVEREGGSFFLTTNMPSSLLRAISFVNNNLSYTIPVKALAKEANYSEYHFSRVFKKHTGMSPKKFVICRKIERAK
ncbi:MAG: response regulator, partial [Thermodesulfovibrionales bacterium]